MLTRDFSTPICSLRLESKKRAKKQRGSKSKEATRAKKQQGFQAKKQNNRPKTQIRWLIEGFDNDAFSIV